MHPYGQQCKQPCLPPPLCQQKTGIKGTPLCLPPSWLQKKQACAPQYSQACQQQTHKWPAQQWPGPCYPPQLRQSPQQCVQSCAPQWQKGHGPTCIQQPCQSPCNPASFAPQQCLAPLAMQPCVPRGKGSQQRVSQDLQQCVKNGGQQRVPKGGPMYASQPCMTKGGPRYITKGNQQYTSQQCIMQGGVECATKSGRQWSEQQCVKKGGPAYATKGSWQYAGKGSPSQQRKSQVKMSSSGQKYCSAGGWPW